jgi:hypothetical protein
MTVNDNLKHSAAGRFILDHSVAAWLIWFLVLFVVNSAMAYAADLDPPRRFGFVAWLTIFELVAMPVHIRWLVQRRDRTSTSLVIALAWALVQAPLLLSYGAMFDRAPQWLVAAASTEAFVVMAYSLRIVHRDRSVASGPRGQL